MSEDAEARVPRNTPLDQANRHYRTLNEQNTNDGKWELVMHPDTLPKIMAELGWAKLQAEAVRDNALAGGTGMQVMGIPVAFLEAMPEGHVHRRRVAEEDGNRQTDVVA